MKKVMIGTGQDITEITIHIVYICEYHRGTQHVHEIQFDSGKCHPMCTKCSKCKLIKTVIICIPKY